VLFRSASGTAVTQGVVLAGATLIELEVEAKGLPLAVDQMAKLGAGAEGRFSVAECVFTTLCHVRMGPTEADNTEGLRLVGGAGAKGMGGS